MWLFAFIPKQYFGYLSKGHFLGKRFIRSDIQQLITQIRAFRDARDQEQFHNFKDLALALSIEASELLELFLWKGNEDANPEKLKNQLADVLMYALLLADKHGLDIKQIVEDKMKLNHEKYLVEKAKGSAKNLKLKFRRENTRLAIICNFRDKISSSIPKLFTTTSPRSPPRQPLHRLSGTSSAHHFYNL